MDQTSTLFLLQSLFIGIGATLVMDAWAWLLRRFGVPSLDYALVGRWLGHFRHGRFRHPAIGKAAPMPGEQALGWTAHYAIGALFAALLLALAGPEWLRAPTLPPALLLGLASVAAPFLLLQPAFGAGVAARKTPQPVRARLRSLSAHASFGVGLYLSALALAQLQ
ncbi:DUF2938 domain-containing protein [Chromobacterium sp. IIBBL 290-4]|uniref:DUF2938 domain-containing protein n=1 Tax=Chromobacterium sp. IIBBL 290-4 TaxID=2953890 RepID=UPI0020B7773B|nr:DUF2938 domain-containing protein [Chromobacterium sp. IIBBL 290-4]UTH76364.1 DUF2938 domain-containing protein [Chromobacterium sp. IIBBL 290-4]